MESEQCMKAAMFTYFPKSLVTAELIASSGLKYKQFDRQKIKSMDFTRYEFLLQGAWDIVQAFCFHACTGTKYNFYSICSIRATLKIENYVLETHLIAELFFSSDRQERSLNSENRFIF